MGRTAIDPAVCNGRPVIRGTRITGQAKAEFLQAGDSVNYVLERCPPLIRGVVLACPAHSAKPLGHH